MVRKSVGYGEKGSSQYTSQKLHIYTNACRRNVNFKNFKLLPGKKFCIKIHFQITNVRKINTYT